MSSHSEPAGILLVCDANVCRSVGAELALAAVFERIPGFADVRIRSRGVNVVEGAPACGRVTELRDDEGWARRAAGHASRRLEATDVERSSLVLTATREVRSVTSALSPSARHRVFTMCEAVWLAGENVLRVDALGDAAVLRFAEHLDGQRGLRPPPRRSRGLLSRHENPFDIADGHGAGERRHRAAIDSASAAGEIIGALISGSTGPRSLSTAQGLIR